MKYFPFLKWAGGKRWLTAYVSHLRPPEFDRYVEPFLGGGAMFGALAPKRAMLSDLNAELVNCYLAIRDQPTAMDRALRAMQKVHSDTFYYRVRRSAPRTSLGRAMRFLYLNRSCFNGIYRVNQQGYFNVPKGTKQTVIFEYDDFGAVSRLLAGAEIVASDFEQLINQAGKGDFLFCDPPYTVAHNNNGFLRYNEHLFSWEDQKRLRDAACRANERGASVLITNAAHSSILDLYVDTGFEAHPISRASIIGGGQAYRGRYNELLISNYALPLFSHPEVDGSCSIHRAGSAELDDALSVGRAPSAL